MSDDEGGFPSSSSSSSSSGDFYKSSALNTGAPDPSRHNSVKNYHSLQVHGVMALLRETGPADLPATLVAPGAPKIGSRAGKASKARSIVAHATRGGEKEFYSMGALAVRGVEKTGELEKKLSEKADMAADKISGDSQAQFVALLAKRAREKACPPETPPQGVDSVFVSAVKINLDLHEYVRRLTVAAKLPAECLAVAAFYLEKLTGKGDLHILPANIHGVCLSCMMMASKMYEDIPYANSYWSALSGTYPNEQLNRMELAILELLSFQLNVNELIFKQYAKTLVD
jgi:hypothetical protein